MTVESENRTPNLGQERGRITEQFIGAFERPVGTRERQAGDTDYGIAQLLLAIAL
jgi:hypothetical protein